jgi:hypothetical protein
VQQAVGGFRAAGWSRLGPGSNCEAARGTGQARGKRQGSARQRSQVLVAHPVPGISFALRRPSTSLAGALHRDRRAARPSISWRLAANLIFAHGPLDRTDKSYLTNKPPWSGPRCAHVPIGCGLQGAMPSPLSHHASQPPTESSASRDIHLSRNAPHRPWASRAERHSAAGPRVAAPVGRHRLPWPGAGPSLMFESDSVHSVQESR